MIDNYLQLKQKTRKNQNHFELLQSEKDLKNFIISNINNEKYFIEIKKNHLGYKIYFQDIKKDFIQIYEIYYYDELTKKDIEKLENSKNFLGVEENSKGYYLEFQKKEKEKEILLKINEFNKNISL